MGTGSLDLQNKFHFPDGMKSYWHFPQLDSIGALTDQQRQDLNNSMYLLRPDAHIYVYKIYALKRRSINFQKWDHTVHTVF